MASYISWIDFSEEDRQKLSEAIKLLGDRDTRDELGISSIRDAISDLLFPGTSTLQTRARYFLLVPWIFDELENKDLAPDRRASILRKLEGDLIDKFLEANEADGLIGAESGRDVERMPSEIYWNGLKVWGILKEDSSISRFLKNTGYRQDRLYEIKKSMRRRLRTSNTSERDSFDDPLEFGWDPEALALKKEHFARPGFALHSDEANFLFHRIHLRHPKTLLGELVQSNAVEFNEDFPWQIENLDVLSEKSQRDLEISKIFSETIFGAFLLYNLMVSELAERSDLADEYQDELANWHKDYHKLRKQHKDGLGEKLWKHIFENGANISRKAKMFFDSWQTLAQSQKSLVSDKSARELITERERQAKGANRMRLNPANLSARQRWSGASALSQLNYRWSRVRRIITDINEPRSRRAHS